MKTLREFATIRREEYPKVVLFRDSYVDDFLTDTNTEEKAKEFNG